MQQIEQHTGRKIGHDLTEIIITKETREGRKVDLTIANFKDSIRFKVQELAHNKIIRKCTIHHSGILDKRLLKYSGLSEGFFHMHVLKEKTSCAHFKSEVKLS